MVRSKEGLSMPKRALRNVIANAGILLRFSLSACAVGPDYRAPSMTLGTFHNAAAVEARKTVEPSAPIDRWWTGFRDPVLSGIVERALVQNLDLAAALARVDQARAAARRAGAELLTTTDLTGQVVPIRQSLESPIGAIGRHLPGFDRSVTLYDVGLGASWEIDLFGGLRRGAEVARAEAEAAEAAQLGTRITVTADAADAYFLIRGDQARLAFAHDQIATDEQLLELVRFRADQGIATEREIAQAEALLSQARSTIPPLVSDLEVELNRL